MWQVPPCRRRTVRKQKTRLTVKTKKRTSTGHVCIMQKSERKTEPTSHHQDKKPKINQLQVCMYLQESGTCTCVADYRDISSLFINIACLLPQSSQQKYEIIASNVMAWCHQMVPNHTLTRPSYTNHDAPMSYISVEHQVYSSNLIPIPTFRLKEGNKVGSSTRRYFIRAMYFIR